MLQKLGIKTLDEYVGVSFLRGPPPSPGAKNKWLSWCFPLKTAKRGALQTRDSFLDARPEVPDPPTSGHHLPVGAALEKTSRSKEPSWQKRSGADFSAAKQHSVNTGGLMAHPSRRHGPNGLNSFSAQGARKKKHWKSQSSHPPQRWISIRESACERLKGAYQVTQVSHFDWHSAYCGRPCFKERRETQHHVTTSTVPRQPSKLAATNGPMKKQH